MKRNTEAEMKVGRHVTRWNMGVGLVEELQGDLRKTYNMPTLACYIMSGPKDDAKSWMVRTEIGEGLTHEDTFWEFPSDTLKAMLALVCK